MNDQPGDGGATPAGSSGATGNAAGLPTFVPSTDILESKEAVVMLIEMPGADPAGLEVMLERRTLTVSATASAAVPQGASPLYAEYRDGIYERSFSFSDQVDGERIEAAFRNGVLRLTLPKADPSPARKIAVQAS